MTRRQAATSSAGPAAAALALAFAVSALAPAAGAAPGVAAVVNEPGPVANRALVGGSGELFRPDGVGTYRRQGPGGVAVDVELAVAAGGRLYAAGHRSPLFVFDGRVWRQHRVGQNGRAQPSTGGGVPAVAIHRQVFILERERWVRAASTRVWPVAVWAGSRRQVYVADDGGGLYQLQGRRWRPVRTGLVSGDAISHLAGTPRRSLVAVSRTGRILDIGTGASARDLPLPGELEGWEVGAACAHRDGTVLLVGHLTDATSGNRIAVALAVRRRTIVEVHRTPLAENDQPAACATDAGGNALWVSRLGQAWLSAPEGQWTERRVAMDPIPVPGPANRADKRPARTR